VRPCLLLVPSFSELQWTIKPLLEEWAEVASYDAPGVGAEPLPPGLSAGWPEAEEEQGAALREWRHAAVQRGLELVDELGWDRFYSIADAEGTPIALGVAKARPEAVEGIAMGHASLSRSTEGDRPAINREVWSAMLALLRTDRKAFIRHGMTQVTAGSLSEDVAEQIVGRYPDSDFAAGVWEALGADVESMEEDLAALDLPLLLGQHAGCLGSTEEGYQDIVARFPDAARVSCPDACSASPPFAEALREFCLGARE
jgi:pimeloyl-ACP methyl ester carboxylesterase